LVVSNPTMAGSTDSGSKHKLQLQRHTLRRLTAPELLQVIGGNDDPNAPNSQEGRICKPPTQ
jgi:hypothetical protein